jgi:ABC-type polysaccharide/polyol phosphate export permease
VSASRRVPPDETHTSRGDAARAGDVLVALAASDVRVRYGRGPAAALKWLLDPIAALGIYLLLVVLVLDRGGSAPGLTIACAVVPFQLVMMTVVNALRCIELRRSILLNLAVPRMLLPVASALTESVAFAAAMVLPFVMMAVYGVAPTAAVLWLIPAIAVTFALAAALAYPAALLGVWLPELSPFFISVVRALFFLAPGLVALDAVSGDGRRLLPLNPLTGIFETFRDALLYGRAPDAWQLLVPLGAALLVLAIGLPLYRRDAPHLAKVVTGGR